MKTLIIAPHPDDDVFACSSFLVDGNVAVAYVTQYHPLFPGGENVAESRLLMEELGSKGIYMWFGRQTNRLDLIGQATLIGAFERLVNKERPDTVLLASPTYNQDHRAVYDAALTAMRAHDRIHFVKRILLYEEPDTFGTMRKPVPFNANYFRPLDMDIKLWLCGFYQTQKRGHRSEAHLEAIASVRGMQANMEYAEAFEVVRWVE